MDDLMKLAQRAGIGKVPGGWVASATSLAKFAALVAAAERERCAKVCESVGFAIHGPGRDDSEAFDCADAIRAMKD